MVTSQAAAVPSASDRPPTPAIRIRVSARARGSTVVNRCGHTFCSAPRASTMMVPIGSRMMPARATAKTVQARVRSARLALFHHAARRTAPGARRLGTGSITIARCFGRIGAAFTQPEASIGRAGEPLRCDMVRPPTPLDAPHKLKGGRSHGHDAVLAESYGHAGPAPEFAVDLERGAVGFRQGFGKRQAKAQTSLASTCRR